MFRSISDPQKGERAMSPIHLNGVGELAGRSLTFSRKVSPFIVVNPKNVWPGLPGRCQVNDRPGIPTSPNGAVRPCPYKGF